jgi:CheY-like chemotaxis protein
VNDLCAYILLAEDNPADQRLISEAFSLHGVVHKLEIIENGADALNAAATAGMAGGVACPDLFILDLHLPYVDGLEVLKAFRENPHCKRTPVLLFTSSVDPVARRVGDTFPGVHFFEKPVDLDAFLALGAVVKSILLGRSAAGNS